MSKHSEDKGKTVKIITDCAIKYQKNLLDCSRSKPFKLVLRRKCGEKVFSEIVLENETVMNDYYDNIKDLLSEELKNEIKLRE